MNTRSKRPQINLSLLVTILFVLIASANANAQGQYTETEVTTFGVAGSISRTDTDAGNMSEIGVTGTLSAKSKLDIQLGVARSTLDNATFGDLQETDYMVGVAYYVLKQSKEIPVSLALSTAYIWGNVSNLLHDYGLDGKDRTYEIGATIYRWIRVSPKFVLIPAGGAGYSSTKATVTGFGYSQSETDTSTSVFLGLSMLADVSPELIFHVDPYVAIGDNTTLSLSLGFVFTD